MGMGVPMEISSRRWITKPLIPENLVEARLAAAPARLSRFGDLRDPVPEEPPRTFLNRGRSVAMEDAARPMASSVVLHVVKSTNTYRKSLSWVSCQT